MPPDAACKSRVYCRRRYRELSFAAAEVSPCGQGKEVGLVNCSTTLTPPLGTDPSRSPDPEGDAKGRGYTITCGYFCFQEGAVDADK